MGVYSVPKKRLIPFHKLHVSPVVTNSSLAPVDVVFDELPKPVEPMDYDEKLNG